MKSSVRAKAKPPPQERQETTPKAESRAWSLAAKLGLALVLTGLFTRVTLLGHPDQVVFDEVHFGKFVTSYCCSHSRFFDIHPPHAKLLIALAIKLGGYHGTQKFENIGEVYHDISPWAFRIVPALVGSALPFLVFILLLQLGASLPAAFLGGLALCLDNSLVIQSRVISLDGVLLLAQVGALVAGLAAPKRKGWKSWAIYALCGVSCGLAVGTKFTGLAAPALVTVLLGAEAWKERKHNGIPLALQRFGLIAVCAVAIYLLGWAFHFALLDKPGPGDAFYTTTGHFFSDLSTAHESMLSKNYGLTATHPNASRWWSWPLMLMPIFYWINKGASLYFLGNPVVWWGMSLVLVLFLLNSALMKITEIRVTKPGYRMMSLWFPILCYAVALVPLVPVPRALFLYHYLTPLVFSVLVSVLWLDGIGWTTGNSLKGQRHSYYGALAAIVIGFLLISPVTYGFGMPDWYWKLLPWTLYH